MTCDSPRHDGSVYDHDEIHRETYDDRDVEMVAVIAGLVRPSLTRSHRTDTEICDGGDRRRPVCEREFDFATVNQDKTCHDRARAIDRQVYMNFFGGILAVS